MKKDNLILLISIFKKKEESLLNNESVAKYNKYSDMMVKHARKLIKENRQNELLPYLKYESVSIQYDVAGLLYNLYPDECREVLKKISEMSVETGMPKQFSDIRLSAITALEYGIPKDFP